MSTTIERFLPQVFSLPDCRIKHGVCVRVVVQPWHLGNLQPPPPPSPIFSVTPCIGDVCVFSCNPLRRSFCVGGALVMCVCAQAVIVWHNRGWGVYGNRQILHRVPEPPTPTDVVFHTRSGYQTSSYWSRWRHHCVCVCVLAVFCLLTLIRLGFVLMRSMKRLRVWRLHVVVVGFPWHGVGVVMLTCVFVTVTMKGGHYC